MRISLCAKIVVFTTIPVVLTHVALLVYGVSELRDHAAEEFGQRVRESVQYRAILLDQQLRSIEAVVGAAQPLAASGTISAAPAVDLATRLIRQLPQVDLAAVLDPQRTDEAALAVDAQGRINRRPLTAEQRQQWRALVNGWSLAKDTGQGALVHYATSGGEDSQRIVLRLALDRVPGLRANSVPGERLILIDADDRVLPATALASTGETNRPMELARLSFDRADDIQPANRLSVADLTTTGWRLGAVIDAQGGGSGFGESGRRLAGALGISLLLITSATWIVANRLTRPLRELDASIDEIARGNLDALPQAPTDDEIGRLVHSITDLAQQLRRQDQPLARTRNESATHQSNPPGQDRKSQRRLEQLITETRATEEALRQARDEAQLASKAKSEFLSNMSHELRTPLNGVLGYAQILRRDQSMTDRQRENLDAIESCGQHLLTLINDVLDISKIEAGRMNVDIGPTDLHKLIKEVYDIVMQRAQSRGLALRVELDPTLPRVIRTDGTKLRQILLNLLGNAVKFTQEGWVVLRAQDTGKGSMQIEVEDTGIGIPDDKVDMIFDPFKQAEAGMVIGGSGLGLAINQRLIGLLGGEPLQVDTALDRGSRFTFELPLEAVSEDELPETQELMYADEANVRLAPGQKVAVLVVDDRRENRDILRRLLSDAGFTVEEADNGRVALQMMQDATFDLILMDIRMPGMSGMEAIRVIRDQPETSDQRVVAVTASVFPEFREQIKAAGFDEFLGKPFRSGELFHKIRELLQLHYVGLQDEQQSGSRAESAAPEGADGDWPTALARAAIKRIRSAVELGDITALADLADKLRIDGRAPSTDIDTIARLGRSFDFDGLTEFTKQLERTIG